MKTDIYVVDGERLNLANYGMLINSGLLTKVKLYSFKRTTKSGRNTL